MISLDLARALRGAGLRWEPRRGDRFVIPDREMDAQVFVLSDMTVEIREFPASTEILFNGTVEWALDSIAKGDVVWMPLESQLREKLGSSFVSLTFDAEAYAVTVEVAGTRTQVVADTADEAYGRALLFLATGELPDTSPSVTPARQGDPQPNASS